MLSLLNDCVRYVFHCSVDIQAAKRKRTKKKNGKKNNTIKKVEERDWKKHELATGAHTMKHMDSSSLIIASIGYFNINRFGSFSDSSRKKKSKSIETIDLLMNAVDLERVLR